MKNLFLSLLVIISGCSVNISRDRKIDTYVFDLRKYSERNFFISSTPFVGSFDPVGEIFITVIPGTKQLQKRSYSDIERYVSENISSQELLEIIVLEAEKLGADALVNLSIKPIYEHSTKYERLKFDYYELSGLAIKRK